MSELFRVPFANEEEGRGTAERALLQISIQQRVHIFISVDSTLFCCVLYAFLCNCDHSSHVETPKGESNPLGPSGLRAFIPASRRTNELHKVSALNRTFPLGSCLHQSRRIRCNPRLLPSFQEWVFLGRFCFLSLQGHFKYNISFPKEYGPVELLLYYDAPNLWETVYRSNLVSR